MPDAARNVRVIPEQNIQGRRRRFPKPAGLEQRFMLRVSKADDGCWIWLGSRWARYGKFCLPGDQRRVAAHRWAYEHFRGPVPEGLELDHLCRNIWCVNPGHLEPVTHKENVRRGMAGSVNGARQRTIAHCPAGHAYDAANTCYTPRGSRTCRACQAASARRRRATA